MMTEVRTLLAPQPAGFYSQAVRVGDFLFISGQLPFDKDGQLVKGSISDQVRQALLNIKAILAAAGGTLGNVVHCTVYIDDVRSWSEVNAVYGAFFGRVPVLPARAIVPVKEMHHGSRIEIQAIAHINEVR
jgi:2-iminobutanoate/2-iminopropanoate deaminase